MNKQITRIIREFGYKRTKTVFYHKAEDVWYISTNVFVLRLHMDDYKNIDQKDKDTLDEIIDEKGEEKDLKVYESMFNPTEDITYTGFLTQVANKLLAIYDVGDRYAFLDQDVTLGVDPAKFNKVAQKIILIAELSDHSDFAAVELISQEATNRINNEDYFTSEPE